MNETLPDDPSATVEWMHKCAPRTPPPAWLTQDSLPALRWSDGAPAPIAEPLIRFLKKLDDPQYKAALRELLARLDAASLRRFLWSVFEQYAERGKSGKDLWTFEVLATLKDDETAQRIGRGARDFQARRQYPRASQCLAALARMGTVAALSQLDELSRRHSSETLRQRAETALNEAALLIGMSREELSDEITPTYGMTASAPLRLDFGGRAFFASIDPGGAFVLVDEAGKVKRSIPKPGKSDDPASAQSALETVKWIKASIKEQFPLQASRLESAMIDGRSWDAVRWRRLFLEHPWMRWIARRIVWAECESHENRRLTIGRTFRVAEDWSLADADDEAMAPAAGRRIAAPHPLLLSDEWKMKWREVFADYQIEQPFAQLERECPTPAEAETLDNAVDRYVGCVVDGRRILWDLGRQGWSAGGYGVAYEHRRSFPTHGIVAVMHHTDCPRFQLGEPFEATLRELVFEPMDSEGSQPHRRLAVGMVDPVVFSEAVRDVERLARTARLRDADG